MLLASVDEECGMLGIERGVVPLALILEEERKCIGAAASQLSIGPKGWTYPM
jgi:hypothetical protein